MFSRRYTVPPKAFHAAMLRYHLNSIKADASVANEAMGDIFDCIDQIKYSSSQVGTSQVGRSVLQDALEAACLSLSVENVKRVLDLIHSQSSGGDSRSLDLIDSQTPESRHDGSISEIDALATSTQATQANTVIAEGAQNQNGGMNDVMGTMLMTFLEKYQTNYTSLRNAAVALGICHLPTVQLKLIKSPTSSPQESLKQAVDLMSTLQRLGVRVNDGVLCVLSKLYARAGDIYGAMRVWKGGVKGIHIIAEGIGMNDPVFDKVQAEPTNIFMPDPPANTSLRIQTRVRNSRLLMRVWGMLIASDIQVSRRTYLFFLRRCAEVGDVSVIDCIATHVIEHDVADPGVFLAVLDAYCAEDILAPGDALRFWKRVDEMDRGFDAAKTFKKVCGSIRKESVVHLHPIIAYAVSRGVGGDTVDAVVQDVVRGCGSAGGFAYRGVEDVVESGFRGDVDDALDELDAFFK